VTAVVASVSSSLSHSMSKPAHEAIRLVVGLGVEGDAHSGRTDQHLYHMRRDPTQPNLRQVHLIHAELHEELRAAGFDLAHGEMGENVTTRGIDLLDLPAGTRLRLGDAAIIEVTGLRNPCHQLDKLRPGLKAATLDRDAEGNVVRKAGVMAIVIEGGTVRPGDAIAIELPAAPHQKLQPV
jgi:MOSC domain-containing protein YiiM